jgi:hypothetical protein
VANSSFVTYTLRIDNEEDAMRYTRAVCLLVALLATGFGWAQEAFDRNGDGVIDGSPPQAQAPLDRGALEGGTADTLIAIGWDFADCPVGVIDLTTGAWTALGSSGFTRCNAMARDSSEVFFATYAEDTSGPFGLITIDTATGAGTLVGMLTPAIDVRAIAFSAADVLYAVVDGGGNLVDDQLWTIDPATGNGTYVGDMAGFDTVQGLAFHHPSGTLYAVDNDDGLLTVDPATGATTDVNVSAPGTSDVQTVIVTPDGTIYGTRYDLYTIDPTTGVYTLVATGGYPDLRGADFTGPIPVELMGFAVD